MRFKRRPRVPYEVTDRKRAAAARAQRRECTAMPLLSKMIAAAQPSLDAVMQNRVVRWESLQQQQRDQRAADWRRARCTLARLPADVRAAVRHRWDTDRWLPGDPVYLLDMLHDLHGGKLVIRDGTLVRATKTITAAEAAPDLGPAKPMAKGWGVVRR